MQLANICWSLTYTDGTPQLYLFILRVTAHTSNRAEMTYFKTPEMHTFEIVAYVFGLKLFLGLITCFQTAMEMRLLTTGSGWCDIDPTRHGASSFFLLYLSLGTPERGYMTGPQVPS